MFESFIRALAGLVSAGSILVWVPSTLLFGGELVEQLQGPTPGPFRLVLPLVATTISAALSVLFACGMVSSRFGPPRPKLWLTCIAFGIVTFLVTWHYVLKGRSLGHLHDARRAEIDTRVGRAFNVNVPFAKNGKWGDLHASIASPIRDDIALPLAIAD